MGNLTVAAVNAAFLAPGTYQDGEGLFLKVDRRGGAYWNVRVQKEGKRSDVGLGSAKMVSLAEARALAAQARKAIHVDGRDLLAERRAEKAAGVTFRQAAESYHAENKGSWKSAAYSRQWLSSLERHAFPKFGDRSTDDVMASDIIAALANVWQAYPETGRRVRHRICQVLNYAHAKGWRLQEAPSTSGSLKAGNGLPKQVKEREHRKAMPYTAIPTFMRELRAKPSFGRLALELVILTAVRSQEARLATWSEFDLELGLWTVPAAHMKRAKAHVVPLSAAALAVLQRAAAFRLDGANIVFPGNGGAAMSDMTLLKVLRDAGEPYHVHGFRSTFTDWAADRTNFSNAVVDAAKAQKNTRCHGSGLPAHHALGKAARVDGSLGALLRRCG